MKGDRAEYWRAIKKYYDAAEAVPAADRAAFLETVPKAFRDDLAKMLEQVDRLAAGEDAGLLSVLSNAEPAPPDRIGPYQILDQLGAGGMGRVYLGSHQTQGRGAAIKVLSSGWKDPRRGRRFAAEISVLANLQHPNIATLYESGVTDDQRPWFAMEYVDGLPVDEYCAAHELPIPDVCRVFLQVCRGIASAHAQLVLHRDLKPSNVLVMPDEQGQPLAKVIDLGLHKSLAADHAPLTMTQNVMGTPQWMAPEQTEAGKPLDVRTDVYALGSLLFAMLTGRAPFRPSKSGHVLSDLLDRIRTQDPPLPSSLNPAVDADLDAIVLKAMAKNPEDRYQSVAEFEADVLAYLAFEPVKAAKITRWYFAKKLLRRHWRPVVTGAGVFVLVFAALIFALDRMVAEAAARKEAEFYAERAIKTRDFIADSLVLASPFKDRNKVTMPDVMNYAAEVVEERFGDDPLVLADIRQALATTYLGRGDVESAQFQAEELERIAPTAAHLHEAMLLHALIHLEKREYPQAEARCDQVIRMTEPQSVTWLKAQLFRAHALGEQAQLEKAEGLYQNLRGQLKDPVLTAQCVRGLATTLMNQGRYQQALEQFEQALAAQTELLGKDHPRTLETLMGITRTKTHLGEFQQSLTILKSILSRQEQLLGKHHPSTLATRVSIQSAMYRAGDYNEAKSFGEDTVQLHKEALGTEALESLKTQNNLAAALAALGEFPQALEIYQVTYEVQARVSGRHHPLTLSYGHNLGSFYITLGRYHEAQTLLTDVWKARRDLFGVDHIRTLFTQFTLGECYVEMGEFKKALPLLEAAYAGVMAIHPPDHEYSLIFGGFLGYTRCQLGQSTELLTLSAASTTRIEPKYRKRLTEFAEACQKL